MSKFDITKYDSTKVGIANYLREAGLQSNQACVELVYRDVRDNGGGRFANSEIILASARKLGIQRDEALFEGVFDEGFQDFDCGGTRGLLLSMTKHPINPSNLRNCLHDIYRDQPQLLALNSAAQARREEATERNRMIHELTAGGNFTVVGPDGRKTGFDVDGRPIVFSSNGTSPIGGRGRESDPGFEGMDFAALKQFHATVMEQRRLQSLSPQELRREINPQRQQIFEASTASARPNPAGLELVTSDGAVLRTKRELIRYINTDPANTKRLIQRNGRTDTTLARIFEQILNGEN